MNININFAWFYSLGAAAAVIIVGRVVLHYAVRNLRKIASRTTGTWDEQLIEALRKPMHWLIYIGALAAAAQFTPEIVQFKPIHWSIFRVALVLWMNWALWRTASTLIMSDLLHNWTDEARNLMLMVARVLIFILAMLGLADSVGISLTPVLASLGVGSLAVALALQETLANFFAGIYLLIDKPVRVGDYVKTDESTEGHIVRIGWRSTWLRTGPNNLVVIPNGKLLSSQLTNFNLGQSECFINLAIGVSYDSDLNHVESTLISTATEVLQSQGINFPADPPVVRFRNFGDSSIDMLLVVKLQDITQQAVVRHQLVKRIHQVFKEQKIDIPYPHRTLLFPKVPGTETSANQGPL